MFVVRREEGDRDARIEQMLNEALRLVSRRPQEALTLARQGAQPGLLAQALYVQGQCLLTLGYLTTAQEQFTAAQERFTALNDSLAASICRREVGVSAFFLGQLNAAHEQLLTSLTSFTYLGQSLEQSICLRWLAQLENFRHDTSAAQRYLDAAQALLATLDDPAEQAHCSFIQGLIAARRNDRLKALELFAAAAEWFSAQGQDVLLGRVYCEQGYALLDQEQFAEARAVAQQALTIFRRHGLIHRVGVAVELLALVATYTSQFVMAHELLAEAQQVYEQANMQVMRLQALLHRANLDYYLEAWSAAREAYDRVLSGCREHGAAHLALQAESNLGLIAWKQGHYDEALARSYAALEQAQLLERPDDAARCHRQLGEIYSAVNAVPQAMTHFAEALRALATFEKPFSRARAQTEYAELFCRLKQFDQAAELLISARSAFPDREVFAADCDRLLARVALARGDLDHAARLLAACAEVYAAHHMPLALAKITQLEGDLAQMRGDRRQAARRYQTVVQQLEASAPAEAAAATAALAQLAEQAGRTREALTWLKRTVRLLQQARARVPSEHLAASLSQSYIAQLDAALRLAIQQQSWTDALALAEDGRAQVVLAWVDGQRRSEPATGATLELSSRRLAIQRKIEALQAEQDGAVAADGDDLQALAQLQRDYDEALALWRRFDSLVVPHTPQPFDWEACRRQFDRFGQPWQALVYYLSDDHLIGWRCTSRGVQCWERQLTSYDRWALEVCAQPDQASREYAYERPAATLYSSSPLADPLKRLAELLLPNDLEQSLTPDTLLIIALAGPLHTLPFAVLPLQGQPLIAHATLLVTPSLHLLHALSARPVAAGQQALGIGIASHAARSPLPTACIEAALVTADDRQAILRCNAEATVGWLRQLSADARLRQFALIHFATHAWSDQRSGAQAGIALADGDLLVSDIARLDLDADLVALSMCESGVGKYYAGEEILGLSFALLQAGARAVVASLWQLDDRAALDMMQRFYSARTRGLAGPWALAAAQREAWQAGLLPYAWASYVWIGKPAG